MARPRNSQPVLRHRSARLLCETTSRPPQVAYRFPTCGPFLWKLGAFWRPFSFRARYDRGATQSRLEQIVSKRGWKLLVAPGVDVKLWCLECLIMRKIGAYIVIGALAATIVSPSPVSAFGLYFGPFHIGFGHRHRPAHHPHYVAPSPDRARRQNIAKATQADREALTETNTQAVQSCGGLAPGVTNLPIEEMRQTVHPTADQEAALDDLSAASSKANEIIKSSCPTAPPLTPVGRLSAAEHRLEAMIRAVQIVRSPLERLYDSLSDEQRRQFNAIGNSGKGEREPGSVPSGGDLTTLCDQQAGGGFANLPVQRIEQVVRPNTQQQNALADLKKASEDAASDLRASCPTQMPQTPVERLDAVVTLLKVMADAMKSVRPKLENFYASLSDEQKASFNTMGPPQPSHQSSGR
jgi:LTXXQ motif family protein